MHRIIEYPIDTVLPDTHTIKYFLKSKGYSSQNLIALKKYPEGISLNGKPAHVNNTLMSGDLLQIQIIEEGTNDKIKPVELPLTIIYEDEDLMVINKAAGMPTHPSVNNYDNSLANALMWYFERQGIPFVFRCVNRLDKDTSGLTIVAKHAISAGILAKSITTKEYLAIISDTAKAPHSIQSCGTIDVPIGRKPGSVIERMVDWEHGERAVTHYQVMEHRNGHCLLKLRLETGRTHQIRIHMKHLGFPLIGDYLYNPDMEFIQRQALHSFHLAFTHPITGKQMDFTAPMPEDMARVLQQNSLNS